MKRGSILVLAGVLVVATVLVVIFWPGGGLPRPAGAVSDFEGVFTVQQKNDLSWIIREHEKLAGVQIAIVSVVSMDPYKNMKDYSQALANDWGVGQKGKNNGIVIALGIELKQVSIRVGDGLQEKLTNEETRIILDSVMIPEFRKNDYFAGVKKGLEAVILETK